MGSKYYFVVLMPFSLIICLIIICKRDSLFASAYVKETLQDSVKELHQIVELMQKPFDIAKLIDTIEDEEVYNELKKLNVDIDVIQAANPTHEQIMDLLERLRKIGKMRTF